MALNGLVIINVLFSSIGKKCIRKPIDAENINICPSYSHVSRNGSHFFKVAAIYFHGAVPNASCDNKLKTFAIYYIKCFAFNRNSL